MPNKTFCIILLISALLCGFEGHSQNYLQYNTFITKARLWKTVPCKNDSLKASVILSFYDSAFMAVNNKGYLEDYTRAAGKAIKNNDYSRAEKYLSQAYKRGYTKRETRRGLSTNNKVFLKSENFKRLKKPYRKSRSEYKHVLNRKMRRDMIRRLIRDQRHRFRKYKPEKQDRLDSINVAELMAIYQQTGKLPSIEDVGEKFMFLIEPPFLHLDTEDAVFFANILFDMYLCGEYNSISSILDMLDQVSYRHGAVVDFDGHHFYIKEEIPGVYNERGIHRQSFGEIKFSVNDQDGYKQYTIPVHDINRTNEVRKMLGLLSIEEECKLNNRIIYNELAFEEKFGKFKKH